VPFGCRGDDLRLVRHQLPPERGPQRRRLGQPHAGGGSARGVLEGAQQRVEQLPRRELPWPRSRRERRGEVRLEEGVGQLAGDDRAGHDLALLARGAEAGPAGAGTGSGSGASSPAASRSSRRVAAVPLSSSASSVSRASSELSRAAVRASTVASRSIRLSASERRASLSSADWMRLRSSRTSSATAWKVVRVEGRTLLRCTASSMSRTALVSTGRTPSSRPRDGPVCRRAGDGAPAPRRSRPAT
jgi:hypothetical protein